MTNYKNWYGKYKNDWGYYYKGKLWAGRENPQKTRAQMVQWAVAERNPKGRREHVAYLKESVNANRPWMGGCRPTYGEVWTTLRTIRNEVYCYTNLFHDV